MKTLLRWAGAIALVLLPSLAVAQSGTSVQFPAGWAPGTSVCVKQVNGTCLPVSVDNPLPVTGASGGSASAGATSATTASVPATTAPTSLLAANTNRAGASITNDSTAIMYVLVGTGTVSATNYTFAVDGKSTVGGQIDLPAWAAQLAVSAVWASANGAARVTAGVR